MEANKKEDLIRRSGLLEKAIRVSEFDEGGWERTLRAVPVEDIEAAEAVDAAPAEAHGRWIDRDGKTWCDKCGASNKAYKPPFCPHCGARMDGVAALMKPLTLDEARELRICWIEEIDAEEIDDEEIGWEFALFPAIWLHKGLDGRYDLFAIETEIDNICSFKVAEYGINWRCWMRKPTDEERRAVEWEG